MKALKMLGNTVLRRERVRFPVRVILVDSDYLKSLKKQFLGKEGPPDVLAFPLGDEAEVYISVEEAARRGPLEGEVARLMVHALLHLAGYSHGETMERKTEEYLERWGV